MTHNYDDEPLEPRLQGLLDSLKAAPPRDPEAMERGLARFLAEAESLGIPNTISPFRRLFWRRTNRSQPVEETTMTTPKQRFALTTLAVIVIALVFLFGGAGMTVYAAQSALPGDALYPFKTTLEQTQASLTRDAAGQAQISLRFAERRLDEMSALASEKRFGDIGPAAAEFERHIRSAADDLQQVSKENPILASQLAARLSSLLSRSVEVLSAMAAEVPDAARPAVERAIQVSQDPTGPDHQGEIEIKGVVEAISPESLTVSGRTLAITALTQVEGAIQVGNTVEVHGRASADGSLTALSIQLEDAAGENANVNQNANDNLNHNGNQNGDDLSNDNGDDNTNDNSEIEDNQNDEDSGDHEGNVNANANTSVDNNANTNGSPEIDSNHNGDGSDDHEGNVNANTNTGLDNNTNTNSGSEIEGNHNGDSGGNQNTNTNTNENDHGDGGEGDH